MGVAIYFKVRKSDTILTHTTDCELKGSFMGIRDLLPCRAQLEFMGLPCPLPTKLFMDNAAVDAVIDANRITPRVRHVDIPIAFLHEHNNKTYTKQLIRTHEMLADLGTKPLVTILHKRFKYWATGARFLPPKDSEHWNMLMMEHYEKSFIDVRKAFDSTLTY